jgi:hypothetical protein
VSSTACTRCFKLERCRAQMRPPAARSRSARTRGSGSQIVGTRSSRCAVSVPLGDHGTCLPAAERIGQSGTGGVLEPAAEDLAEHGDPEGVAELVHRAFAHGLDLTFVVAAGFGLVAAIAVLAFVRPDRARAGPGAVARRHPPDPAIEGRCGNSHQTAITVVDQGPDLSGSVLLGRSRGRARTATLDTRGADRPRSDDPIPLPSDQKRPISVGM